jgi:fructuronate reductase
MTITPIAAAAASAASAPSESLSSATLDRLPIAMRPLVDPRELQTRVVHFGLGAFHRAHQAVYTEAAAARSGQPWGIAAIAPGSVATVTGLREQDCLYSVTDLTAGGNATRVVGSITEALLLRQDPQQVRDLLRSPEVSVVTLTITEKGYHRRADTGGLDTGSPAIVADLAATGPHGSHGQFMTVIGRLAAALADRYRAGGAPISVVSCDNMATNGVALAGVVHGFIAASGWVDRERVLEWTTSQVAFPATVVDRIVPVTTDQDRDAASVALGVRDTMAVVGEPYRQWVLQDSFAGARPPWELGGAQFVSDVAPYQLMKLRLLNGSHSALAYLGLAAGCETVTDALHTDWGERLVRGLAAEIGPTLPDIGLDVAGYTDNLVDRFRNPAMRDQLRRIGCDGSLKIGERWLGALRSLRTTRAATPILELALAGWVNATRSDGDGRQHFGTTDPAADTLADCWERAAGSAPPIAALLRQVGAADLADDDDLTRAIAHRLPAVRAGRIDV